MKITLILVAIGLGLFGHKYFDQFIHKLMSFSKQYMLSLKKGRALQSAVRKYFSSREDSILLPSYKFFTPFCYELRELQLRHGLLSSRLIAGLRPWITQDIQFEENVQSLLKSSLVQFFILSLFTWVFYFNAISSLDCEIPWLGFSVLQLLGLVSFLVFYQRQRVIFFKGLDELFKKIFLFQSLKKVGLSMGEVLSRSEADQQLLTKDKDVQDLADQLIVVCQKWTKEGRAIDVELEEIANELIYLREAQRKSFETRLTVLRFMHLIGFYLFGYLLVILALIRQLALSY